MLIEQNMKIRVASTSAHDPHITAYCFHKITRTVENVRAAVIGILQQDTMLGLHNEIVF
ncbi:hypothetical protein RB2083_3482 [Rhodobacteraceae bacterium HTCC2083]|nr:hypothetical protein RB2083_3482 [Rhodobacteraceae bacterium HTCC2083]